LILQHDHDAPAGVLAEWAGARGWTLEVVRHDRGETAPPSLAGFDRLVSLGSACHAGDNAVPWQDEERRTLRLAADEQVPVLGICFGGQSLALALGGAVRRAARAELGWVSAGTAAPELVDDGPWLSWHVDEILPPAGAEVLARNEVCVQAWRLGPHVGLQFHPEVDEAIVAGWIAAAPQDPPVPADLAQQTAALAPDARERAFRLFDQLLTVGASVA
jgi:GMP synthase-like glutamine amidotransferase